MKYSVLMLKSFLVVAAIFAIPSVAANATTMPSGVKESIIQNPKVTPLLTKELAGLAGKEAMMLTVEYAPGASSSKHRHNAHTFVYVLEGSLVMQIAGGKETILAPGQTFYESPDDVHSVSKNASNSQPAKFLVFFVKDKGAPVSVPAQ